MIMRTVRNSIMFVAMAAAVLAVGPSATAQQRARASRTQTDPGSITYEFLDDPLAGGTLGPHDGIVKVPTRRVRGLLIRPRTQFVTEMLKSVESI